MVTSGELVSGVATVEAVSAGGVVSDVVVVALGEENGVVLLRADDKLAARDVFTERVLVTKSVFEELFQGVL